jgi:hypothetical protein
VTGAAGVHDERAGGFLDERLVGVAENHDGELGVRLGEVAHLRRAPLVAVDQSDPVSESLELQRFAHLLAHIPAIDVSVDGIHGRYDLKLGQDGRIADVARMQDLIYVLESSVDLVAKQSVSVRYEADTEPPR